MLYRDLSPEEKIKLYAEASMSKEEGDEYLKKKAEMLKSNIPEPKDKEVKEYKGQKQYKKQNNEITKEIDSLDIEEPAKEYLKRLGYLESRYQVNITNPYGYMGLYQFGDPYLKTFGYKKSDIKDNSKLQHELALKGVGFNTKGLEKYFGKTKDGIKLNKYNLAAAAHLGGKGNLMKYLSGEIEDFSDAYGTSLKSRLKEFEDVI